MSFLYTISLYSYACGIEVEDQFIVTGGNDGAAPEFALNTVARYNESGLVDYLPSLNQRRYWHACSSFISDSGETVGFIKFLSLFIMMII